MARPCSRAAAAAGIVAASLLIGAPGDAVAFAKPGGRGGADGHSTYSDDENRHRGDGNRDGYREDRGDRDTATGDRNDSDSHRGAADEKPDIGDDRPRSTVGSGRTDTANDATSGNETSRSAASSDQVTESSGAQDTPDGSESTLPSGSDVDAGAPPVPVRRPEVRFGNGRPPVVQHDRTGSGGTTGAQVAPTGTPQLDVVAPPAPPQTDGPSDWSKRLLVVAPLGSPQSGRLTDPILGLIGLVLIPVAGAALGYRQARAAQAAGALSRS